LELEKKNYKILGNLKWFDIVEQYKDLDYASGDLVFSISVLVSGLRPEILYLHYDLNTNYLDIDTD